MPIAAASGDVHGGVCSTSAQHPPELGGGRLAIRDEGKALLAQHRRPRHHAGARRDVEDPIAGRHATVRWGDCDVILRSPNGDRELIGRDAIRIYVCSGRWKDGFEAIRLIDKHAPPELFVDLRPQAFPAGGWMVEREGDDMFAAPSWEHDGWALIDLTRHGGEGGLPSLAPEPDLAALDTGDIATVFLTRRADDDNPAATEALKVMVASASHEFYAATLEHASSLVPALGENAGIAFAPHHVAEVRRRKIAGAAWRRFQKLQSNRR